MEELHVFDKISWGAQRADTVSFHLFLQLAQLCRSGLQADAGLLQLLMRCSNQVAAPVGRLTSIFQLTGGTRSEK